MEFIANWFTGLSEAEKLTIFSGLVAMVVTSYSIQRITNDRILRNLDADIRRLEREHAELKGASQRKDGEAP